MTFEIKRLEERDYQRYVELRVEGFSKQNREFRFSPEDELALSQEQTIKRIKTEFIIGAFDKDSLVGIGGVTPYSGSKLNHRALLWGMYVKPAYRGLGLSNKIVESLVEEAGKIGVEKILLTVVSENHTAINLYKKWGFTPYATDRFAVKISDNDYLDEMLMVKSIV